MHINILEGICCKLIQIHPIQVQQQLLTYFFGLFLLMITIIIAYIIYSYSQKRERAEKALLGSKERYRNLFESVPVGLYRTQPNGQIIDANPALVEMLGYPDRDSLLEMNAREIYIHPQDRQREMGMLDQECQPVTVELQLRRFDGSSIWVRDTVRPICDPEGKVLYYDGSLEDITEHRRADEAHRLLASIVKSSEDAIIGETMDSTIVSWNSGAEKIFGYKAEEVIGRSLDLLLPDDRIGELARILACIKRREHVEHYETIRIRKDRRRIDVSLSISPIIDTAGNIIGVSKIARDISEHKHLEQFKLRMERLSAMGKVTASLAHEVKNPLQAIQSNLDLMLDFPIEESERQECLRLCRKEAENLIEITQRMLVFSKPDQSTFREVSIAQIWNDTLALVEHTLQNSKIVVKTDIPADLPAVRGAAHQLRQVFLNLLLNSIEALQGEGMIDFLARQDDDQLLITLTNNGPSIPKEHLERIFEPFFTSKPGGAGLGLFISSNILQGHGGMLQADNLGDGSGVVFTISIPLASLPENLISTIA